MTKIIISPILTPEEILNPQDFEIYIQRIKDGNVTTKHFKLDNAYSHEYNLEIGDLIGVTYLGVMQKITDGETNGDGQPTFRVKTLKNDPLLLLVKGATEASQNTLTNTVVQNDVGVNLKSFNLKEPLEIKLTPSTGAPTKDQAFWDVISSHQLNFKHYSNFIDDILTSFPQPESKGNEAPSLNSAKKSDGSIYSNDPVKANREKSSDSKRLPFNRTEAYSLLKYATERYVGYVYNLENYVDDDNERVKFELNDYLVGKDNITPYYHLIKAKIKEYFISDSSKEAGFLKGNADTTLIELIWSYWHEEGKVNQTMNAIARRFQNIKNGYKDPLLNFALDPLRPLNNILWGYIQDTQHRLTSTRRNYEYTSEYDLCVMSSLKPGFNPADRRSKFLQSFHRLIYEATEYFIQSDNTTIRPDGFKLLNAIRDTHRILAEGAHNEFGNLPTVARIEMLIEQWILSRSEIREFLGGRIMVPYEEPWMDRVDSMKALQGWDNTSISFYRDLAVYGEQIVLSIRYGDWTNVTKRDHATNWADAFRDAIQRYIHSYYTVTGIDLAAPNVNINSEEKYTLPGYHIRYKQNQMMRRS